MFPWNENRNEGTFACSTGTKTGTRVRSPKPPFYETALLSPGEKSSKVPRIFGDKCTPFFTRHSAAANAPTFMGFFHSTDVCP